MGGPRELVNVEIHRHQAGRDTDQFRGSIELTDSEAQSLQPHRETDCLEVIGKTAQCRGSGKVIDS